MKNMVKKAAKIAGVTCVVAGAVALLTSAAAIKAMTEGGKYLKETVRKIIDEPRAEAPAAEEAEAVEAEIVEEKNVCEEETE